MAKNFYGDSPLLFFPILALILFIGVFLFVSLRTLGSDKKSLQSAAGLPLTDDTNVSNTEGSGQ